MFLHKPFLIFSYEIQTKFNCWPLLDSMEPPMIQRMTPAKYSIPHARASFGPTGQLIRILPNSPFDGQPAVVEITDVAALFTDVSDADELRRFPGPLIRYAFRRSLVW